mgnify:CR=1 FL=1
MNNYSAHDTATQVNPKTIDVEPKQQPWVGGHSRKRGRLGQFLMLFEETPDLGYRTCRKFVKEILMLQKKREDRFVKWRGSGLMRTEMGLWKILS